MNYEPLITEVGIQPLQLFLGLAMGLTFGIGTSISHFCLRKLVLDLSGLKLSSASYTWLFGLGVAIMATQLLLQGDTRDITEAQVLTGGASLSGPIIGGLMFGFGIILSRGCASRQIIQLASGCSIGAGLSGTAVMATSSVVTLIFILFGGLISARYNSEQPTTFLKH